VSSHAVLGRLLGLGMRCGSVGRVLLGRMRRSGFGLMRVMPRDVWMRVWMRDLAWGHGGRERQRHRNHPQLPDHVIMFGRELPGL
jgi:hypothetical protein